MLENMNLCTNCVYLQKGWDIGENHGVRLTIREYETIGFVGKALLFHLIPYQKSRTNSYLLMEDTVG